jgi:fibronectin type 3 domain-containing protein
VLALVVALLLMAPAEPPEAPQNLRGWASTQAGSIELHWDAVEGAATYRVYEATSSAGPFEFVAQTTATTHVLQGRPPAEPRYYRVTAENEQGESAPSNTAGAIANSVPAGTAPPATQAPTETYQSQASPAPLAWSVLALAAALAGRRDQSSKVPK